MYVNKSRIESFCARFFISVENFSARARYKEKLFKFDFFTIGRLLYCVDCDKCVLAYISRVKKGYNGAPAKKIRKVCALLYCRMCKLLINEKRMCINFESLTRVSPIIIIWLSFENSPFRMRTSSLALFSSVISILKKNTIK